MHENEQSVWGRLLVGTRHPLRLFALCIASLAVTSPFASTAGIVAAVLGALFGLLGGEILGRTRVRSTVLILGMGALLLGAWFLASLVTETSALASLLGGGGALRASALLRYGSTALVLTGSMRVLALRWEPAMALELVFVVVSVAAVFASHRDGVIARPLWLSDWAWQKGFDPADILLFLGGLAATVLAALVALERGRKKPGRVASSLLALPILALVAVACLDVAGRPKPEAEDGLGLTDSREGDPPQTTPDAPPDEQGPPGDRGGQGEQEGGDAGARPSGGDGGATGQAGGDGGGGGEGAQDGGHGGGSSDDGGGGGSAAGDGGNDGGSGGGAGGDGGTSSGGGGGERDGSPGGAGTDGGADGGGGSADAASGADAGSRPPSSGGGGGQGESQPGPPALEQQMDQAEGPSNSPAPMAIVVLHNDYSPPAQGYYFRQEAWSQIRGARLVPSTVEGADADTLEDFPTRLTHLAAPPAAARSEVFASVALLVEHQRPFGLESPTAFQPAHNPNPDRFVRAYQFRSLAQSADYGDLFGSEAGNPEWSPELRANYLEMHEDPRFAELAETILADLGENMRDDPFARAVAIKLYLDKELTYSTKERHADAPDPTVAFLFGNRIGYCVHFAHAAVFLMRAAGLPARAAAGYMVPEENRRGGSAIMLRSGDAHAWPELYLRGVGWVILDIAPERNLDEAGTPLDEDLQRQLGEQAREQPPDPEDEIEDEEEAASSLHINPWMAALFILGVTLLVLYGIKGWRRLAPALSSTGRLPRVAYRVCLDRLSEVGLSREYGETREQFALRVAGLSPSFARITDLHVASRLRDPSLGRAHRQEYMRGTWNPLLRSVRKELRSTTRWWRRLIGLLHPVSFLDSR